jgi:hypothetical protein
MGKKYQYLEKKLKEAKKSWWIKKILNLN